MTLRKDLLTRSQSLDGVIIPKRESSNPSRSPTVDDYLGRSSQIMEVLSWLESSVESAMYFSSKPPKLFSRSMIFTFAYKIALSNRLPFCGLLRTIIFSAVKANALVSHPEEDMLLKIISIYVWIFCTSNYQQLLLFTYGLYDTQNNDYLERSKITSLISDILVHEEIIENFENEELKGGNQMIRVSELVDELFDYCDATTHSFKIREESFDSVAGRCSPSISESGGISCMVFVQFFTKKRRGSLWPLLSFQRKLQECSFGLEPWDVVINWARLQPNGVLRMSGPRLSTLHRILLSDLSKFLEVQKMSSLLVDGSLSCLVPKEPVHESVHVEDLVRPDKVNHQIVAPIPVKMVSHACIPSDITSILLADTCQQQQHHHLSQQLSQVITMH